ncbi:MAG: hypothetical protein P4M13_04300 [Alphaproteobacteria bacterium]|nr:hypothetical protein [Alphaproteobacteria bacterium]
MAKEKAEKKTGGKPQKKSGGKLKFISLMAVFCVAAPFIMPTLLLALVGLIPTYVAFTTDDDPQKSGATSVCAMNFAGLTPFVIDLWEKGQTMANAVHILSEANSWLVILGAAAIGQLIVYTVPPAIATLTLTNADARIKNLRKNLEMLKQSWGPDVATTKPIDKIVQG